MIILTDVDGVLLNWEKAFEEWMVGKGYTVHNTNTYDQYKKFGFISKKACDRVVEQFNTSAWMGFLEPIDGSVEWVKKLVAEGHKFEVITSMATDKYAVELRKQNLRKHFGDAFVNVICLDTGADKDDILKTYDKGMWWIEDKPKNCLAGLRANLKPILIEHHYNKDFINPNVVNAKDWQEIYKTVTKL